MNLGNFRKLEDFENDFNLILTVLKEKENEFNLNDISNLLELFKYNVTLQSYTLESLSKLSLEKLRKLTFDFKEYNLLFHSFIKTGNKDILFWNNFLSYIKLYTIKNFDDYIKLKSGLQILEKELHQIDFISENLKFLENKYEKEEIKEINNL